MQWELAKPIEFEKSAKEDGLCIVPIGCLERHGEQAPFGTDCLIAHKIAVEAAKIESCMVFPPLYFGTETHEAICYSGNISFPNQLCFDIWDNLCAEISRNGFKKILFLNGHGGNRGMLDHYALSTVDRELDYTFYYFDYDMGCTPEEEEALIAIEPRRGNGVFTGHACQWETDLVMSAAPGSVNLDYIKDKKNLEPLRRSAHLGRINTGLHWYSNWPDNVVGEPAIATKEKGDKLMEIYINMLIRDLKIIKEDTTIPALRKEFLERKQSVGKFDE